jgi:hypothetical protein
LQRKGGYFQFEGQIEVVSFLAGELISTKESGIRAEVPAMKRSYEELTIKIKELQREGTLPVWPTNEQRADWAFGNTAIENDQVTRKMAQDAAAKKPSRTR